MRTKIIQYDLTDGVLFASVMVCNELINVRLENCPKLNDFQQRCWAIRMARKIYRGKK